MSNLQRGIFYGCSYFLISLFLVACGGSPDEIAAASTGALTGTPTVCDIGTTSGSLSSDNIAVSNTVPGTYVWGVLDVDQPVYIDRSFTYTDIPDSHRGLRYLQTANDDKFVSAPDAISFTVDRAVTVLVAYDARVSVLPTWLQSWGATGLVWDTTDVAHDVYQKDFPAGSVVLGGNEMGFSMYSLAIAEQGVNPPKENSIPSICGVPETLATQDVAYSFVPAASDADVGDILSFTIDNQPSWSSFDPDNGALTGTPSMIDVGMTFSDITISVSDGQATASLAPFAIEVLAVANGSAMLTWVAPTKNEDDTLLTDLGGFTVYYSQTLGNYPNSDPINDPFAVTHTVDNLSPGTWFFVVTARDTSFNESEESNTASKTISPP